MIASFFVWLVSILITFLLLPAKAFCVLIGWCPFGVGERFKQYIRTWIRCHFPQRNASKNPLTKAMRRFERVWILGDLFGFIRAKGQGGPLVDCRAKDCNSSYVVAMDSFFAVSHEESVQMILDPNQVRIKQPLVATLTSGVPFDFSLMLNGKEWEKLHTYLREHVYHTERARNFVLNSRQVLIHHRNRMLAELERGDPVEIAADRMCARSCMLFVFDVEISDDEAEAITAGCKGVGQTLLPNWLHTLSCGLTKAGPMSCMQAIKQILSRSPLRDNLIQRGKDLGLDESYVHKMLVDEVYMLNVVGLGKVLEFILETVNESPAMEQMAIDHTEEFIYEAQRMKSHVIITYELSQAKEIEMLGRKWTVPEGEKMSLLMYPPHMCDCTFPDPQEFRINDPVTRDRSLQLNFGGKGVNGKVEGPRGCLGYDFAMNVLIPCVFDYAKARKAKRSPIRPVVI